MTIGPTERFPFQQSAVGSKMAAGGGAPAKPSSFRAHGGPVGPGHGGEAGGGRGGPGVGGPRHLRPARRGRRWPFVYLR